MDLQREVQYLFNNIVLPPQLPFEDDQDFASTLLLESFADTAKYFARHSPEDARLLWAGLARCMRCWLNVYSGGILCEERIKDAIKNMKTNDTLLLNIKSQNATVLLRKTQRGTVFECFEVSPRNEDVLAAKNALVRTFPARAILIPTTTVENDEFLKEFASLLQKLSVESSTLAMETSFKAGTSVLEERQSCHPRLVSELLTAILLSDGSPFASPTITKRTHDDVCWNDSRIPWRRSPLLLSLKVGLQLALINSTPAKTAHIQYKCFMLVLITNLAQTISTGRPHLEVLSVISAKIARRTMKLGIKIPEFVTKLVAGTVREVRQQMDERCGQALSKAVNRFRLGLSLPREDFYVPAKEKYYFSTAELPDPAVFNNVIGGIVDLLVSFETWVASAFTEWVHLALRTEDDCANINLLIEGYFKVARDAYQHDPEQSSIMILTILELWMALDKITCRLYPITCDYTHEIPPTLLEPLLLSKAADMRRLGDLEAYLKGRHDRSQYRTTSIFGLTSVTSLSVRFFDQSLHLQALRKSIELDARYREEEKKKEFVLMKQQYQKLMNEANDLDCDEVINWAGEISHSNCCTPCGIRRQAGMMRIQIHEWPLPGDNIGCKAAIFELSIPRALASWRDATWTILQDLTRSSKVTGEQEKGRLLKYPPLQAFRGASAHRLVFASITEPFSATHYRASRVTLEQVLVPHGSSYRLYDTRYDGRNKKQYVWTHQQKAFASVARYCITELDCSYSCLKSSINCTTHSQNDLLSKQGSCSTDLGMHEYVAFGSIRAGSCLQWPNILRELASADINFNTKATFALFKQAAWQAGPQFPGTFVRENHLYFRDPTFTWTLLQNLERAFSRIEANWKETNTAFLLLILAQRLLSLVADESLVKNLIALILKMRCAAMRWARQLAAVLRLQRKRNSTDDDVREHKSRAHANALLARSTFNVEGRYYTKLLSSETDVADYVECSIIMCDYKADTQDKELNGCSLRDHKFANLAVRWILRLLKEGNEGLALGIGRFWDNVRDISTWGVCKVDPAWLIGTVESSSQLTHFNLITGELLVAGQPLGILPAEYRESEIYQDIFGSRILDVVASDMPDMHYMTTKPLHDYQIHLSMRDSGVIIRAKQGLLLLEAISRGHFAGDLPSRFLEQTVQWLNLKSGVVEFRGRDHPLEITKNAASLYFSEERRCATHMQWGQRFLLDAKSECGKAICRMFRNFEKPEFIQISASMSSELEFELPRYRMKFFLNASGKVESRELSAVIDEDQSIGTFTGLQTKLVLRVTARSSSQLSRIVLVPFGEVRIRRNENHVGVDIKTCHLPQIECFLFKIDMRLARLDSEGNLEAHLFKAYLHAITSSPLPDPLTGRTGTEESLLCMADSITSTTMPLTDTAMTILRYLANLTPVRRYYPEHMKSMQQVKWHSDLSSLAQHDHFAMLVQRIIKHNQRSHFLFKIATKDSEYYDGDLHLLQRSSLRTRKVWLKTFDLLESLSESDVEYSGRDRDTSHRQAVAYDFASLIAIWPERLEVSTEIYSMLSHWGSISGFNEAHSITSISNSLDLNLASQWPSLFTLCRSSSKEKDRLHLTFLFSIFAFGQPVLSLDLKTLLAFAFNNELKTSEGPNHNAYLLNLGYEPILDEIMALATRHEKPQDAIAPSHSVSSDEDSENSAEEFVSREKQLQLDKELVRQKKLLKDTLTSNWPMLEPQLPQPFEISLLDHDELKMVLIYKFDMWFRNLQLFRRFAEIETQLRKLNSPLQKRLLPDCGLYNKSGLSHKNTTSLTLIELIVRGEDPDLNAISKFQSNFDGDLSATMASTSQSQVSAMKSNLTPLRELQEIIRELSDQTDELGESYATLLARSASAFEKGLSRVCEENNLPTLGNLVSKKKLLEDCFESMLAYFALMLGPKSPDDQIVKATGYWPIVSTSSLLALLTRVNRKRLSATWYQALIAFAKEVSVLQRIDRMIRYSHSKDSFALQREYENQAHEVWDVSKRPDWLLLEIWNNFLIRGLQVLVAEEMLKPSNGVLQLDMGQGKTSVILPMVIAVLADERQLLRVVVLKPLLNEALRSLSASLSGLVAKTVWYLPFSRQNKLTQGDAEELQSLFEDCKTEGGVIVTLPEILNSFRLVGWDSLYSNDRDLSNRLLDTQRWLDEHSRDICDESDELLGVQFELVYTVGQPRVIAGQPDRWLISQDLLTLVSIHAHDAHRSCPRGVEFALSESGCQAAFPHVRILTDEGASILLDKVVDDVLHGGLPTLALSSGCNKHFRSALRSFITQRNVSEADYHLVTTHFANSPQLSNLFVVRGLIAFEILKLALQKRWIVNYGLARNRSLSAVPYRAKSTPAVAAEFAQPELLIQLTALSHYYTGLSESDVRQSVVILLKMTDPDHEYEKWIRGTALPAEFCNVHAVNADDESFLKHLHTHLRHSKGMVDFFLANHVFPKEAKEFTHKLSTNAWHLCSDNGKRITGGFSGTADNRALLPLPIPQKDIAELDHTSASVLVALLRPENRRYICAADEGAHSLSTRCLLNLLVQDKSSPSVLIDVGAQVLNFTNEDFARAWLSLRPDRQAAVFYDEKDERLVLNRDDSIDLWRSSPFRDRLSNCLVFLDQFRARGTDLRLPDSFTAAVTLGPGLTKDTFVQAVMRMRKVGYSQSIITLAPPEIDNSIRSMLQMPDGELDIRHVIQWTMLQSRSALRSQFGLWVKRGLGHGKQRLAQEAFDAGPRSKKEAKALMRQIRERECRPASEMYEPVRAGEKSLPFRFKEHDFNDEILHCLREKWKRLDALDFDDGGRQEEQEREILHEVEQQREMQLPPVYQAHRPEINEALIELVREGYVGEAFLRSLPQAFSILSQTSAAAKYESEAWAQQLYATRDFHATILQSKGSVLDFFLRPIRWVLSSKHFPYLVLISPHEANALIPHLRTSTHATLHTYSPKVSKSMADFSALDFYNIPSTNAYTLPDAETMLALQLFAGQLYLRSFAQYRQLCNFLGLFDGVRTLKETNFEVSTEGFVPPPCRTANNWQCKFTTSPLPLIKELIGMRRKGLDFGHTHMGMICKGNVLTPRDFEGVES